MAQPPWKDALARARRTAAPAATPAMASAAPATAPPSLDRLAETAPGLGRLLAERQALERQMTALTGGSDPADPRYAVEPLDRRRAALAAWGAGRDAARARRRSPDAAFAAVAPPLSPPPLRGTSADMLRGTNADVLRATPGELPASLRIPPAANDDPPLRALERLVAPAAASRRERSAANDDPPLGAAGRALADAGRALADAGRSLGDAGRAARTQAESTRERPRPDPLDRRLARARDMAGRARRLAQVAERALDGARDAIPDEWQERARERIPGLGRADNYVRETARKLQVAVGTVDEIGQKADRLRSLARDMRELKQADEANDEARRERAIERLKARRQED